MSSTTLAVVLTWAERIATAVLIAVPAIRSIASELETARTEVIMISSDLK